MIKRYFSNNNKEFQQPEKVYTQEECSLCLDKIENEVQTSCGHVYCGDCLLQAIRASQSRQCPICRSNISMIYPNFDTNNSSRHLVAQIVNFNKENKEDNGFFEEIAETIIIIKRLLMSFDFSSVFRYRKTWTWMIIAGLYLFSPIDLLPEVFFGIFGLVDDIYFLIKFTRLAANEYKETINYILERNIAN